jgi:hypothetical protein
MIEHEVRYLAYVQEQGVGDNDQVASSPKSYVSYLRSAARRLDCRISPEILHSENDIGRIAAQLSGRLAPGTIRNCCSAMRHYVAMVKAFRLWPGATVEAGGGA